MPDREGDPLRTAQYSVRNRSSKALGCVKIGGYGSPRMLDRRQETGKRPLASLYRKHRTGGGRTMRLSQIAATRRGTIVFPGLTATRRTVFHARLARWTPARHPRLHEQENREENGSPEFHATRDATPPGLLRKENCRARTSPRSRPDPLPQFSSIPDSPDSVANPVHPESGPASSQFGPPCEQ